MKFQIFRIDLAPLVKEVARLADAVERLNPRGSGMRFNYTDQSDAEHGYHVSSKVDTKKDKERQSLEDRGLIPEDYDGEIKWPQTAVPGMTEETEN